MATKGPMTAASLGKTGAMGPSPYRMKGTPTRAKVLRAKAQAVGGARKRCRKGKNCSAACIQSGMVCLVEFPIPAQTSLTKVRDYIRQKNNVQPGSIQDKRINAALGKLASVIKVEDAPAQSSRARGPAKPEVSWKRDEKKAERLGISWNEVQGLKKRKDLLSEAEIQRDAMKALHKDALTRGLRLPRAELEMIYDVLPKNVQTSLAKTGRAGTGQWYGGKDENGNIVKTANPGKERAIAVLDLWFRQGGTDAYQGRGGRIWAPPDLDVEHIIPLSKGGIDAPSNWIMARAGANRARQSQRIGEWIDRLPKTKEEHGVYLQKYAKERRAKQARRARAALVDPRNLSDREVFSKGGASLAEIFRAENGGKTPGTFTKEWLGIASTGSRTGNSGPPAPFAKGLGLIAKDKGLGEARVIGNRMKNIWNKDWKQTGAVSKQEAYQQMMSEMKSALTGDQFNNLFEPAARSWAKTNGFL